MITIHRNKTEKSKNNDDTRVSESAFNLTSSSVRVIIIPDRLNDSIICVISRVKI
jgi:hypothetical protein